MPKQKTEREILSSLKEVAVSTVAARHVGTAPAPSDPLKSLAASSSKSKQPQTLKEVPSLRLHCREVTCLETFESEAEMRDHDLKRHNAKIDELLISSDEDDEIQSEPPRSKGKTEAVQQQGSHPQQEQKQPHQLQQGQEQQRQVVPQDQRQRYQVSCDKCSYKTFDSYDPATIVGMASLLKVHCDLEHAGDTHEEADDFKKLTKPVRVAEGLDDRDKNLHDCRYLGYPLDWRVAYHGCPLLKEPVFGRIDLIFRGVTIHNTLTLERCHNRGGRSLRLDHFSEINLKTSKNEQLKNLEVKKGGGLVEKKNYEELQLIPEAVKAA